ncbi:hypothetical protein R6Z07F_000296 [Ovis aries]
MFAPERSHPVLLPHLQAAGGDQAKKDDFLSSDLVTTTAQTLRAPREASLSRPLTPGREAANIGWAWQGHRLHWTRMPCSYCFGGLMQWALQRSDFGKSLCTSVSSPHGRS